jgi:hypothetical protein
MQSDAAPSGEQYLSTDAAAFWREDFQTVCIDSFTLKQALK